MFDCSRDGQPRILLKCEFGRCLGDGSWPNHPSSPHRTERQRHTENRDFMVRLDEGAASLPSFTRLGRGIVYPGEVISEQLRLNQLPRSACGQWRRQRVRRRETQLPGRRGFREKPRLPGSLAQFTESSELILSPPPPRPPQTTARKESECVGYPVISPTASIRPSREKLSVGNSTTIGNVAGSCCVAMFQSFTYYLFRWAGFSAGRTPRRCTPVALERDGVSTEGSSQNFAASEGWPGRASAKCNGA